MEEPPVRQAARFGESQLEHWLAAVQSRRRKGAEMNLNEAIAHPFLDEEGAGCSLWI